MLADGRGLAMMHVLEHGLGEVLDLVIAACVSAQAYDPQCEASRAPWLYRMIRQSPQRDQIVAAIFAALPQSAEMWDIEQMCDLAALLAEDDARAGPALRNFVLGKDFLQNIEQHGCRALVKLDGMHAVELLARRFGALLLRDPEAWPSTVETLTDDILDAGDTLAVLEKAAVNDAELAAYLRYCKKEIEKRNTYDAVTSESRVRNRLKASAEQVFAAAETDTRLNKGYYRAFGRFATADELELALQKLLVSETAAVCVRLLWIFNAVKAPRLEARIFELARHKDEEVRYAAMDALSKFSDCRVRDVALAWLASDPLLVRDGNLLKLFTRNYREGDETFILAVLERLGPLTDDECHSIACSLVRICEENHSATIAALAEWIVNAVRCSVCRRRAVTRLVELAVLPEAIAQESLFDADPATELIVSNCLPGLVKAL